MNRITQGLKITFLIHFVVGLVFGLIDLLIPELWGDLTNWPVQDPTMYRLVGAAILAFAASSILAYRETDWDKVILIVRTEIVWTALATLVFLVALIFGDAPAIGVPAQLSVQCLDGAVQAGKAPFKSLLPLAQLAGRLFTGLLQAMKAALLATAQRGEGSFQLADLIEPGALLRAKLLPQPVAATGRGQCGEQRQQAERRTAATGFLCWLTGAGL